jgi:hypothetical protein
MHLRRAILLFALVLGLTALAAAVAPSQHRGPAPPAPPPGAAPADAPVRTIALDARASSRPRLDSVKQGEQLRLTVSSAEGGLVTIPALGRTASVSPATPAEFDLLAPPPGRYDVLFAASGLTEPRRAGTIVSRP